MIDRSTRLRWRRRVRKSRRQVEDIGSQAEEHLDRHFFRRLNRLAGVQRFIISWVLLMVLLVTTGILQTRALTTYYQELKPAPGGVFKEAMLGAFTNANPVYSSGVVDSSVSKLLFSGLLRYDQQNKLANDLAENWTVDDRGVTFTVTLRDNLKWHDGQPLTVEDVLFTYQTIQNPDAQSPLLSSWQGVTIKTPDSKTIVFTLPNSLSAFPYSLTGGIIPKHLLKDIPKSELRSARFNTVAPVGSGPFKWSSLEVNGNTPETRQEQIGLLPNESYHLGSPQLGQYIIQTFREEKDMLESFQRQEFNGMSGLDSLPDTFQQLPNIREYSIPLAGSVMVFFKNSHEILSDANVRKALVQAANTSDIIRELGYPLIIAKSPLLPGHVGYNKGILQLPHNQEEANRLLDEAGWPRSETGVRKKDNKPLKFNLYSKTTSEYHTVTKKLQEQWRQVGAEVEVILQPDQNLQTTVSTHGYDALLYGISIGNDPDVFAFWHSSQADILSSNRLNFSEYKSETADGALEAGRTRFDAQLRAIKYEPFLQAWQADAPALALYQPRFLFVSRGEIYNFKPATMSVATDRYTNVHNWMIREVKTTK